MSGGSLTKDLVRRVNLLLAEQYPSRVAGSPLPSVEQIAIRLQARHDDLKRCSQVKILKQLKDVVFPEIQRVEQQRASPAHRDSPGGDAKKRKRDEEDATGLQGEESNSSLFVIDTNGDRMKKGGNKLVAYTDTNRANKGLHSLYSKSTTTDMGMGSSPMPAVGAAEGGGAGTTGGSGAASRSGARVGKASRGSRGKKGSSRAAEVGSVKFRDLGGVDKLLQQVRELIEYPLAHPEIYAHLGVEPPRGVLLHGPPGSGKSLLAGAMAAELAELGVTYFRISAPEVVSSESGGSEKEIREIFAEAKACAPSLIFIDEIDAITGKRENAQREMERRIVAQLLTCMDDLASKPPAAQGSQRDLEMQVAASYTSSSRPHTQGAEGLMH